MQAGSPAARAAYYREKAAELRKLAEHAGSERQRIELLSLAIQYDELAAKTETRAF